MRRHGKEKNQSGKKTVPHEKIPHPWLSTVTT
jgi:hypothetical protein